MGWGLRPEPRASGCRMGGPRKGSDLTLVELGITRGFSVGRAEVTFGDHGSCQVENRLAGMGHDCVTVRASSRQRRSFLKAGDLREGGEMSHEPGHSLAWQGQRGAGTVAGRRQAGQRRGLSRVGGLCRNG